MSMSTLTDNFGITIDSADRVRVLAWGDGARLVDCGITSPVVRINRTRVVIVDSDGYPRAVSPSTLGVIRRDDADSRAGYEGNRSR